MAKIPTGYRLDDEVKEKIAKVSKIKKWSKTMLVQTACMEFCDKVLRELKK